MSGTLSERVCPKGAFVSRHSLVPGESEQPVFGLKIRWALLALLLAWKIRAS